VESLGASGRLIFVPILINGLKSLDYRGYDSAGLAYVKDGEIHLFKTVGRVEKLDEITPEIHGSERRNCPYALGDPWRSFGRQRPSAVLDAAEYFLGPQWRDRELQELKNRLQVKGYVFASETDTEVIADLLEDYYLSTNDPLIAIRKTIASWKAPLPARF
jgi:glucosamine--fructose-6-phosphate aminotransferase (isomerizing)